MWDDAEDESITPADPQPRGRCGKARYDGEKSARRALRTMQRHGKGRSYQGRLHVYPCRQCRGYHVGHTYRGDH